MAPRHWDTKKSKASHSSLPWIERMRNHGAEFYPPHKILIVNDLQVLNIKIGLDLKLQRYEKKRSGGGVSGGKRGSRARKTATPGRRSLSGVPFGVGSGLLQNREPLTVVW